MPNPVLVISKKISFHLSTKSKIISKVLKMLTEDLQKPVLVSFLRYHEPIP